MELMMEQNMVIIDIPAALNADSIQHMHSVVAALEPDKIAVLRGSQEVFCRGMDFSALQLQDEKNLRSGLQSYADLLLALRTAPCPLIAAVEAPAFGGGVGLVAACDLVLASSNARFGLPEALYGFYPAIVFAVLAERLMPQKARQLSLLCESITADEACDLGLVDVCTNHDQFALVLRRQVRRLLRPNSTAVKQIKQYAPHLALLRSALALGVEATYASLMTPGVRERLAQELAA
jgi:enoyl-CoA hydratase/carnithine racemase